YQGLSIKETAEALDIPEKKLDNDLYNGLKKLRNVLVTSGVQAGAGTIMAALSAMPVEQIPTSLSDGIAALLKGGGRASEMCAAGHGVGTSPGVGKLAAIGVALVVAAGWLVLTKMQQGDSGTALPAAMPATVAIPEGIELEDGRIIFQDDFEKGLGNWNIGIMHGATDVVQVVNDPVTASECVRIEKRDVRGKPSQALAIRAPTGAGKMSFAMLKKKPAGGVLSVEYDYSPVDVPASTYHLLMDNGDVETIKREFPLKSEKGKWYRYRIEVAYRERRDGKRYFEVKEFYDGRCIGHRKCHVDSMDLGCVVDKGFAAIDNYVIREMTPKPPEGGAGLPLKPN
ncbi:MAG: hypothetical protein C0404_12525, partial [Verrucomicrobia bacterium]|nr:hypothetical protein [Verrucomicrobiota bacterium]